MWVGLEQREPLRMVALGAIGPPLAVGQQLAESVTLMRKMPHDALAFNHLDGLLRMQAHNFHEHLSSGGRLQYRKWPTEQQVRGPPRIATSAPKAVSAAGLLPCEWPPQSLAKYSLINSHYMRADHLHAEGLFEMHPCRRICASGLGICNYPGWQARVYPRTSHGAVRLVSGILYR